MRQQFPRDMPGIVRLRMRTHDRSELEFACPDSALEVILDASGRLHSIPVPSGYSLCLDSKDAELQSDIAWSVAAVRQTIEEAYGRLKSPSTKFLSEQRRRDMYQGVLADLGRRFHVRSRPGGSDDICLNVDLERPPLVIPLFLSLVGRYALVFRDIENHSDKSWAYSGLIWDESQGLSRHESFVLDILSKHYVETLAAEILWERIPFRLDKLGLYDYTIFHCLFDVQTSSPEKTPIL